MRSLKERMPSHLCCCTCAAHRAALWRPCADEALQQRWLSGDCLGGVPCSPHVRDGVGPHPCQINLNELPGSGNLGARSTVDVATPAGSSPLKAESGTTGTGGPSGSPAIKLEGGDAHHAPAKEEAHGPLATGGLEDGTCAAPVDLNFFARLPTAARVEEDDYDEEV
jgi:hypothetical protein